MLSKVHDAAKHETKKQGDWDLYHHHTQSSSSNYLLTDELHTPALVRCSDAMGGNAVLTSL